jgi:activator of 2-hydroxyglutaryl-CoA dehydratase
VFATGNGGTAARDYLGAEFAQEVNAVPLAAEDLCPERGSVIKLGEQDAKVVVFQDDLKTGRRPSHLSRRRPRVGFG